MPHPSRSSFSSTSSSSGTGTGNLSGGRTEINYNDNVHQDISSLAARTHAEQSGDSSSSTTHTGRRRMMSQQDGEPPRPDLVTGVTSLEKAAQGGQGFQTYGFDLGVLGGRNNVDDEMRTQSGHSSMGGMSGGGSQHSSSSSHNVQYSSGGRTSGSSSYSTHSSSQGGYQNQDEEYEDIDEYENDDDNSDDAQNSYNTHSSYSYSQRTQSDHPGEFKHYRRQRDLTSFGDENAFCKSAHCVSVRCVVGPLKKNEGGLVALRTRLVAHTLHKVI
jgi:hypothetical protein